MKAQKKDKKKGFGIAQMVCFEIGGTALEHESLIGVVFTDDILTIDRTWCRITFKEYGSSLETFGSVLELLYAFYDAVTGKPSIYL